MGKIRTGFKVCTKKGFGFVSAFNFGKKVAYDINVWTNQPKGCGPMSVFERLSDVDWFISHNVSLKGTSETFLCEYEESEDTKLWDDGGNEFEFGIPPGTYFASRVKLIKKIHEL